MTGCFFQRDEVKTTGLDKGLQSKVKGNSQVTSVSIINDQLIINGSKLGAVSKVKITGPAGFSETFTIESKTNSSIVANGMKNFSFAISKIFSLVISDAYGAATFDIGFTLDDDAVVTAKIADGAVTADKLSDMGAGDGDILVYNNGTTSWEARPLSGLNFLGAWDANTNTPSLADGGANTAPLAGDYYVVGTSGATNIDGINGWLAGDWIIFNGTAWDIVINSSTITSFAGRQGAVVPANNDYTWAQINKTTSSINDIADVDTTGIATGKILKWDGAKWAISDDLSGGGAGTVGTSEIADGSIADVDLAGSISQSKITNLTADLAEKLERDGSIAMTGNLDMGGNAITNVGNVDGVDVSALKTQSDTNVTNIAANVTALGTKVDKTTTVNGKALSSNVTLVTTDVAEGTGLYHTTARAKAAAIVNSTAGTETDQAASVAAMKTYVTAQVGAADSLIDADSNTQIQVEEAADENKIRFDTAGSERMIIDENGDIGVGTANPASQFHLLGTGGGNGELRVQRTAGAEVTVQAQGTLGSIGTPSNHPMQFITNGGTRMTIDTSGDVGIGTSTPLEALSISKASHSLYSQHRVSSTLGTGQEMYFKFDTADGTDTTYASIYSEIIDSTDAAQSGAMELRVQNAGSTVRAMRINNTGNIGIGESNPLRKLQLSGSGTSTTLGELDNALRLEINTATANAGSEIIQNTRYGC